MNDRFIGPVLPPAKQDNSETENVSLTNPILSDDSYGPQLPPHLQKPKSIEQQPEISHGTDSEPDDVVGPLPINSAYQRALEEENYLKYRLSQEVCKSDERQNREEWMMELPPEKGSQFGLEARKFRINYSEAQGSRSSWTETPNSTRKKPKRPVEQNNFETQEISKRNKAMDEEVNKSKKHKHEKSLLELHREKLKKKKKKGKEKQERKPFDRDVDLQVNRFDEGQKKAIIDKAKFLDTRFSVGKSKYL